MYYIFVVNGRKDKEYVFEDLARQLTSVTIDYEIYRTKSEGDATRFVRIYCDFHHDDEVCFVACGGTGTLNEVVNGVIGSLNKRVGHLAYGSGINFARHFPNRNFHSLSDLINGDTLLSDVIKCNNDYAINVVNMGFDSMSAFYGAQYALKGVSKPYLRGTVRAVLFSRFNWFKIVVDGVKLSCGPTMFCNIANASNYGEDYKCAPLAQIDDGHLDVTVARSVSLLEVAFMFNIFKAGRHISNAFCRRRMKFRNARHIEVSSKELIFLCLDGETVASRRFVIDILDKAVTLQLPPVRQ